MGEKYNDKGMLGSHRTSAEPFQNPSGVKLFTGYGADNEDLERGYCEPSIRENPAYDKANYQDRWTVPMEPDEDQGDTSVLPDDIEFRMRERVSKGFMTRPRIPTERN